MKKNKKTNKQNKTKKIYICLCITFNDKTYDDHQLCIFCKYQQLSEVFLQCYFLLLNKMKMSIQFY